MGQPVKLSDSLVLDARQTGKVAERSIAGQIEFWAAIGRAVEPLLRTDRLLALKRLGSERPLSECLERVGTPAGDKQLSEMLKEIPFPHYRPAPGKAGLLLQVEEDGTEKVGRFFNRKFVAEKSTERR